MNDLHRTILTLLATAPLLAAAPSPVACSGDAAAVLAAMRTASGGDHWSEIRTLHLSMTKTAGGQTARAEHWEDLPGGRYLVRVSWPNFVAQRGFDGVTPWHQGRSGIAYTLGDVDAGLEAADESFRVARGWWFDERHPSTVASWGMRQEGGRRFDVLAVTPEGGRPFQAWIDQATHLLARTDEQQAEDRVVTSYSDYRSVQGVMLPFTIRTGDGVDPSFDAIETMQAADINPVIPEGLFGIPPRPASDVEMPPHRDAIEVPFRLTADNRILVPLTIDGRRTVEAEFDSGGSLIVQPSVVAAMALATAGRSKQMGGGEGASTSSNGRIASVALGDARFLDMAFHSYSFSPEEPDKALVGLEVLQRFVVRFDFDRQVMTLTKPEAFRYAGHGAIIPFHFQDNQPEVKGTIDGIAGLFTIDTGDGGSLLLIAPFARRYGLVERYHADLPYEGKAVSATHGVWARTRVATVAFDGPDGRPAAVAHEPVTRISLQHSGFDANRDVSANIGVGILKQFNLTFDYVRQQIILEPNHLYGQKDVFNRAGLRLSRKSLGWVVTAVYPGGAAADGGIKVGDVVSHIDGQAADTLTMDGLWAKLKGPVGAGLEMRVGSGETDHRVVISLRDML